MLSLLTFGCSTLYRTQGQEPGLEQVVTDSRFDETTAKVDFCRDVIPALTRAGCNSGACHGAAAGRGYLRLSLFGARPADDFRELLFAQPARFVDLETAALSKLIQKPVGHLDHGGGVRFDEADRTYALLVGWIEQGAPSGNDDHLQELVVQPTPRINAAVGESVTLQVSAKWKSGAQQDATPWLLLADAEALSGTNAPVQYEFDKSGLKLTPRRAGYWPITVRFAARSLTLQVFAHERDAESTQALSDEAFDPNQPVHATQALALPPTLHTRIDAAIADVHRDLRLMAVPPCSSSQLVRRWWFDLLGHLPEQQQWERAVRQIEAGETEDVIEQLLASHEFAQHMASQVVRWCERSSRGGKVPDAMLQSLAERISQGDTLPSLVRCMLEVPDDKTSWDPLQSFHLLANNPRDRVESIANCWLGVRMECARCHDHPLDRWTQDDYYGLAGCLAEIDVRDGKVRRVAGATTTDLRSGRDAIPTLPNGVKVAESDAVNRHFVDWLLASENDLFYRNVVNRTWDWFFGNGLYEPIDDQRETNPALHAALLDMLVDDFKESGGDLRSLIRGIVLSQAYARQTDEQATPLEIASIKVRKPKALGLPPQELARRLLSREKIVEPLPTARISADAEMMNAITSDRDCTRGVACQDPIQAALELVAGERLNGFIREKIAEHARVHRSLRQAMIDLHMRLFHEVPTEEELSRWPLEISVTTAPGEPEISRTAQLEAAEDLLWSWLVSDRFLWLY